jgi:hypothetical protein
VENEGKKLVTKFIGLITLIQRELEMFDMEWDVPQTKHPLDGNGCQNSSGEAF